MAHRVEMWECEACSELVDDEPWECPGCGVETCDECCGFYMHCSECFNNRAVGADGTTKESIEAMKAAAKAMYGSEYHV